MSARPQRIGGDIGGTKTLLALAEAATPGAPPGMLFQRRYASREFACFEDCLARFLADARATGLPAAPAAACFGVAGPVEGNRAQLTYLPWFMDGAALGASLGGPVRLVNDFAAAAAGLASLGADALTCLQPGQPTADGVRVVVGAGTGLGVAALVSRAEGWQTLSGEGGHVGFAPRNPLQAELWRWMYDQNVRVTTEHLLSGPGLVAIHRFLLARSGGGPEQALQAAADTAAAVGRHALETPGSLADQALDIFVDIYGAFAGDLALTFLPRAGLYLAGGIAGRILPRLQAGRFQAAFNNQDGHRRLTRDIPVHVVTTPDLGLLGALALADEAARGG